VDKSQKTDISPALQAHIADRLADLDFKYYLKGHRGPLDVNQLADRFGTSWLLSWLEKAEDGRDHLRNPGAWLRRRLHQTRP